MRLSQKVTKSDGVGGSAFLVSQRLKTFMNGPNGANKVFYVRIGQLESKLSSVAGA